MAGGRAIELSLAGLLEPLSVQTFLDEIWAQKHYHVARCRDGYFDGLLPGSSALDHLLELFRREPPAVRLMRGKDKKGADSYRLGDGGLDVAAIRGDFADGYTIVVDAVERYSRSVASLAHAIEVELNVPVQVNAYATPPGSQGLVPHYDDHDVVILQIEGSKVWHLYAGVDIPPHRLRRDDKTVRIRGLPPPTDLRLEAGDVLYLPRGRVHAAETPTSGPSVHLTVGLHTPSVLMLAIGALYSESLRNDALNARLPLRHLDDADLQASMSAMLRDALRSVEEPSAVQGGLDTLADVLVRRGHCPPIGQIADTAGIGAQTIVEKYRPLYSRVKAGPDGVALQFATLSIRADSDHQAALEFIAKSTAPFRIADLPGLAAAQQVELARSLIVSGYLVRLSPTDPETDSPHGPG
ncbi:cupin [Mycobacterium colombiense]|uniref:Cupin n=1 Tax=Mycobacterium colombiense TaxID=339268 RepID=A0A1A2Z145_9MYCO|nr:cupin [Mycobacterium colombiense]